MIRNPHPLQWPQGWNRTPDDKRESARFRVTLSEALQDALYELEMMSATDVVVTSDLPTNTRGLPYSDGKSRDPGIAIWCRIHGSERVFACDRWTTHAANARAIGKTIESLRGIDRWGAADTVARAFSGFAAALPAPTPPWLGVIAGDAIAEFPQNASNQDKLAWLRRRYHDAMRTAHPDRASGNVATATDLNVAMQLAEEVLSS
jgi:hypothetical protein